jgi:LPS-assembly protein
MSSRIRFLITAAFVCHLLLAPALVTSQLPSPANPKETATGASNCPLKRNEDGVCALEQEKDGPVYKLHGQAEIHYSGYILRADEVTYNSETGEVVAEGHVVADGGSNDEHLLASRATYNVKMETGKFENVAGAIGVQLKQSKFVLTSSLPFAFTGKSVEKTGPDHYVVNGGTVTTCNLPKPKWEFSARKVVVDVGADAKIYQSTFRVEGVPVLYLPFATHPVGRARQSGFLIPSLGNSSRKGTFFGESVYWAINRSMDATLGAQYFSMRGWAPQGEFRARPSESSFLDLSFYGVLDRGFGINSADQGGANVKLNAESKFPHNFRGVANIDYLTSYVFRLAFNEVFTQAVSSEVKSQAFLSNTTRGYSYNALSERYQNFESTANGDVITILHAPSLASSSVDRQIGKSPFYWSYDAAADGLSRSEPSFRTAPLVGRFDFAPSLALPLQLRGWSLRPEITLRDTFYTQQLVPANGVGTATYDAINRKAFEGTAEIRPPALERVFDKEFLGRKWKHVVEPRVVYRYVVGVDNFDHLLRFDERDIVSDTNEVEYSIVNRLFSKRLLPAATDCASTGMPTNLIIGAQAPQDEVPWGRGDPPEPTCAAEPQVRDVVTWELAQKYFIDPTFGGALVPGRRNVFETTADLTGIAFLTGERRVSPLISRLRAQTSNRTDVEWDLDYDFQNGRINASTAMMNYHFKSFTLGGGDAFLRAPGETLTTGLATPVLPEPERFNQFRVLLGYGYPNKRGFSGAGNVGFDANLNFLQYTAVQTTYNWDCCGVSVEYRRFNLGTVRDENQFRFTFALANIGAFGNLSRRDRLF